MSKTYALIDINQTLLHEVRRNDEIHQELNNNIIDVLLENKITDVFLFDNTILGHNEREKKIIEQLQARGLTVWGVLNTADLFWLTDHPVFSSLDSLLYHLSVDHSQAESIKNWDRTMGFKDHLPVIGEFLHKREANLSPRLGKAFLDSETSGLSLQARTYGAIIATEILSALLPSNPHPKSLLFQHFVAHKPVDCANCIIFEDNPNVINNIRKIAQNNDFHAHIISVDNLDYLPCANIKDRYSRAKKRFLKRLNTLPNPVTTPAEISAPLREGIGDKRKSQINLTQTPWPNPKDPTLQKLDETYFNQRSIFRYLKPPAPQQPPR